MSEGLSLGSGLTTAFLFKVFISPFAVYSNALQESANSILYNGLIEELVDVLQITDKQLMVSIYSYFPVCIRLVCIYLPFGFSQGFRMNPSGEVRPFYLFLFGYLVA